VLPNQAYPFSFKERQQVPLAPSRLGFSLRRYDDHGTGC